MPESGEASLRPPPGAAGTAGCLFATLSKHRGRVARRYPHFFERATAGLFLEAQLFHLVLGFLCTRFHIVPCGLSAFLDRVSGLLGGGLGGLARLVGGLLGVFGCGLGGMPGVLGSLVDILGHVLRTENCTAQTYGRENSKQLLFHIRFPYFESPGSESMEHPPREGKLSPCVPPPIKKAPVVCATGVEECWGSGLLSGSELVSHQAGKAYEARAKQIQCARFRRRGGRDRGVATGDRRGSVKEALSGIHGQLYRHSVRGEASHRSTHRACEGVAVRTIGKRVQRPGHRTGERS